MIRILVVEDEPFILRDLVGMITRFDSRYVVNSAPNAIEAKKLIESSPFDVLITDINMPVMSGLELIEWVRREHLELIPVIISGYSDFNYARQAIKLRVDEYIIKPIDELEVEKTLKKISEKVEERKSKAYKENLHRAIRSNFTGLDHNTPLRAHTSESDSGDICQFMAVFCVGAFSDSILIDEAVRANAWEYLQLDRQVKSILNVKESSWIFRSSNTTYSVLFDLACDDIESEHLRISKQLKAIQGSGFGVTIGISPVYNSISEVNSWHRKIIRTLQQQIVLGKNQLICVSEDDLDNTSLPYNMNSSGNDINHTTEFSSTMSSKNLHYETIASLIKHSRDDVKNELQEVIRGWRAAELKQPEIIKELESMYNSVKIALCCELNFYDEYSLKRAFVDTYFSSLNYDDLAENILALINSLMNDKTKSSQFDKHEQLVHQMIAFIEQHLSDQLNNNFLAQKFGLAPSYISSIFRQKTGQSPIEFIANRRIERACQILEKDPSTTSREIAEIIGYNDPLYFSKSFKKIMGMSPSEYKASLRGEGYESNI
jgi:YesN/AraC family two-component response regulator